MVTQVPNLSRELHQPQLLYLVAAGQGLVHIIQVGHMRSQFCENYPFVEFYILSNRYF